MKFGIRVFFSKSAEIIQVSLIYDKNKGTLHKDQNTISFITRSVLLRMRNISDKSCRGIQNTYFVFSNFFPKIVPFMK